MSRMTADEMVTMVRLGLGGETSDVITDAMILRWLNQSYVQICSMYDFRELLDSTTVTAASGTAEYELSTSSILLIKDVVDSTNGLQLEMINLKQYNEFTQGTTTVTGQPVYWFLSGVGSNSRKQITFFPTPNAALTIYVYHRKRPDDMVTSPTATSPIIPEPWDDSIIQRAIARGWKLLGDTEQANAFISLARDNDRAAKQITMVPSDVPGEFGSIVGRAWEDNS